MPYTLGTRSLANLQGVDERLVTVVKDAILITTQDFTVFEGLRTLETQREYMRRGVSRTLRSKHLTGHAVDLVPWIASSFRWEWPPIYHIAVAMRTAAEKHALSLIWGGVWDRDLRTLLPSDGDGAFSAQQLRDAVLAYQQRHPGPDFIDGPHFEIRK